MAPANRPVSRRAVLAVGAGVLTGCTSSWDSVAPTQSPSPEPSPTPAPRHPFADTEVAVTVIDASSTAYDVHEITRESLAYWEEHAPQYAGFDVTFQLVDDDAAITLKYLDEPRECGAYVSSAILGCAPLIRAGDRVTSADAWIVAGQRPRGRIVTTTKHELGHILGLDHDDEPASIMSLDPADRIPGYHLRVDIWAAYADARRQQYDGNVQGRTATEYWNRERYADAADAFGETASFYRAGITTLSHAMELVDELLDVDSDTVDADSLLAYIPDAVSWFEYRVTYATEMAAASTAMSQGRTTRARQHFDAAMEALDASRDRYVATVNQVGVALGLDDPIVD